MAGSIAAQLHAIKSQVRGREDPIRRPFTRPSILFNPKEAADMDLKAILPIAVSGLDVLIRLDARFESYKKTLFSGTSLEVDREKMVPKEEDKVNKSVTSYLELLAGHMHHDAALKTLEYLIRRYRVHVFNVDELVLCALPYHDTPQFVRIVQLIDLGNSKWRFLEGVKASGAPPPRKVIVQQCLRDKGVLEAMCNYASPTNDFSHSRPVVCFCTAVIVEALGSVQKLDDETVSRILPFVFSGLSSSKKGGRDEKAGALMVAGLLASRATLASKLVNHLISFIARVARQEAKESADVPWIRVMLMAMISIVQSQSIDMLPKKSLKILMEIRNLSEVLAGLAQDFNIEKFLSVYLQTLADDSLSDDASCSSLIMALDALPVRNSIVSTVGKVLTSCLKLLKNTEVSTSHEAGVRAKKIYLAVSNNYQSELSVAVQNLLKQNLKEGEDMLGKLSLMFDGKAPHVMSDSHILFSLEHPQALVRQRTLSRLSSSGFFEAMPLTPRVLAKIQDTVLHQLSDEDLSIVQEVMSLKDLHRITNTPKFLGAFHDVLFRCVDIIMNSSSSTLTHAHKVAIFCLESAFQNFEKDEYGSRVVAAMVFPLLLVHPKIWTINLKALELAKKIKWPFYIQSFSSHDVPFSEHEEILEEYVVSCNSKTIRALAKGFLGTSGEYLEWLIECSKKSESSKCLLFYIMLQAALIYNGDSPGFEKLINDCFPLLENEWHNQKSKDHITFIPKFTADKLDNASCLDELLTCNLKATNAELILSVFWAFLKGLSLRLLNNVQVDDSIQISILEKIYIFFSSSSRKDIFHAHVQFLLTKCCTFPVKFLSRYFSEEGFSEAVQVESLVSLSNIFSTLAGGDVNLNSSYIVEILVEFPLLLVPISSERKEIRVAAMNCVDELHKLWNRLDVSRVKNGSDTLHTQCVSTPFYGRLLSLILAQKKLIVSDVNYIASFLTSLLSDASSNLLSPENTDKRFDQQAKDAILVFILSSVLKLSPHGKLRVLLLFRGLGDAIFKIEQFKTLLSDLLERRGEKLSNRLTDVELETLCFLLEVSVSATGSLDAGTYCIDSVIRALQVDEFLVQNPAVVRPCVAVLQSITSNLYSSWKAEIQNDLFSILVYLFRNGKGDVQVAAKEAILRINVSCTSIIKIIEAILSMDFKTDALSKRRRKKASSCHSVSLEFLPCDGEAVLIFLNSLLDVLLLKKEINDRKNLVEPLYQLLEQLISDKWLPWLTRHTTESKTSPQFSQSINDAITCAQQSTLIVLEDITTQLLSVHSVKDEVACKLNINLLVECARLTENSVTRNHVFMLLSAISRISSGLVSRHAFDLFAVIGESAVKQTDNQSQRVLEELISTMVPCIVAKTDGTKDLLKVFINYLPQVVEHRRLTLVVYLLRTLDEKISLGVLLALLLHTLVIRKTGSSDTVKNYIFSSYSDCGEWEYKFAGEICEHFPCNIWLPSMVLLVREIGMNGHHDGYYSEMLLALSFVSQKLQNTQLGFELESGQDRDYLQSTLGTLMETVVMQIQFVETRFNQPSGPAGCKRMLKDITHHAVKIITTVICLSDYFKVISRLLGHRDVGVKKKALSILCEAVKNGELIQRKHKQKRRVISPMDETEKQSFAEMCSIIIQFVDGSLTDSDYSFELVAVSCLEAFATKFQYDEHIFMTFLTAVIKHIASNDVVMLSTCLRCVSALINVLGPKALPQLPGLMKKMFKMPCTSSFRLKRQKSSGHKKELDSLPTARLSVSLSFLVTLEAVIEKLGCFLNPYMEDIIKLLILHPEYSSESDPTISQKAASIRKLIMEKIPVRLTLAPLLKLYPQALVGGECSLAFIFEMLATAVSTMDRSSIGSYHVNIFDQCLLALDLRRQHPEHVKRIDVVEQKVIHSIVILTLKLTESMFRPLFLRTLEWADSELESVDSSTSRSVERAISFYSLVNKLAEQQRSLFVPYFKYLLDGCTRYLTDDTSAYSVYLTQKRKKAKRENFHNEKWKMSPDMWHLRSLILSSLHKCFLYDSGNLKFLDSSNFQILLKPIVCQLVAEPPAGLDCLSDLHTVDEVDESIVCCLGQMAVTAGSDDIWKQLNHEVLMQTRNEKVRPRILALQVVKYLMEHLKEEYLVLLPETIPFLGELLEDADLSVKTQAQEIFKELETLSGENLRQYL